MYLVFALPLLYALANKNLKTRLGISFCFGLCAYGLLAQGVAPISPVGFCVLVVIASVQTILFGFLCQRTGLAWIDVFYFPFVWCVSEWVRNYLLGGFSFYISQSQAFCPMMLKLYGYFGCLGMSYVIFLVNTLLGFSIVEKQRRGYFIVAALVIFCSVLWVGLSPNQNNRARVPLRVSVIQANILPWQKTDMNLFDHNTALHLSLTKDVSRRYHPDLVIWPETAFPDDLLQDPQWRPLLMDAAKDMKVDILMGMAPIINGKEYNSALMITKEGEIGGLYHKQILLPFAENMPLERFGLYWGRGYHFSEGHAPGIFKLTNRQGRFGVVICSEVANATLVKKLKEQGVDFLVEISNDSWFKDKASMMFHAEDAIMRAVENRIWVVRSANTGFSFAVSPEGHIYTDTNLKLGQEGFGVFDIMWN
ncbi:MAG: apolipoprotein N-acyltransferase [Candidatus Omnitrophica bacterium]|nr:apolipoprotein N-acyltransferase [Candidatus Omnitrophota bacterium]